MTIPTSINFRGMSASEALRTRIEERAHDSTDLPKTSWPATSS